MRTQLLPDQKKDFFEKKEKANRHRNAGNDYNNLRNKARIFYNIEAERITDDEELVTQLKQLDDERSRLNKEIPTDSFMGI